MIDVKISYDCPHCGAQHAATIHDAYPINNIPYMCTQCGKSFWLQFRVLVSTTKRKPEE